MSTARMSRSLTTASWSRQTWAWIAAGAVLVGLAIYAAAYWFEVVDETEWVGVNGEAATNPFLALERLLVAQGARVVPVSKVAGLDAELARGGVEVLVLGASRLPQMTPERIKAIETWVAGGGQLIIEAERLMLDDPLLSRWGLDRQRLVWRRGKYVEVDRKQPPRTGKDNGREDRDSADADPSMEFEVEEEQPMRSTPRSPFAPQRSAPSQVASTITLGDGTSFKVAFMPHQNFVVASVVTSVVTSAGGIGDAKPARVIQPTLLRDKLGGRVAELSFGRGRVTAITGFDFMKSYALTRGDHAEFIWHLISRRSDEVTQKQGAQNPETQKPTVLMMARPSNAGFSQWVVENAWMVLVSLIALIAVWIWSVLPRFGPLLPTPQLDRRSLGEHIRAAGGWLASRREWPALVEPVRARFWARLTQRFPRAANMSLPDRLALAARATALSASDVAWLLSADVRSRRECLQIISSLIDATARLDGEW